MGGSHRSAATARGRTRGTAFIQTRLSAHVGGDHRIVFGGVRSFRREFQARGLSVLPPAPISADLRIVRGVAHDRHVGPSSWPPNAAIEGPPMSMFSMASSIFTRLLDRLTERIEVHADHVDELDLIVCSRLSGAPSSRQPAGRRAFGCRVFTRPSQIRNPVTSLMLITSTPLSAVSSCRLWRSPPPRARSPGNPHDTSFVAYAY